LASLLELSVKIAAQYFHHKSPPPPVEHPKDGLDNRAADESRSGRRFAVLRGLTQIIVITFDFRPFRLTFDFLSLIT
jgi:hypothetical protein